MGIFYACRSHDNSPSCLYERLSTSAQGLSEAETAIRIKHYGYNELPEPGRRSLLLRCFDCFCHNSSSIATSTASNSASNCSKVGKLPCNCSGKVSRN
ncbi:cation-transporting P-type ATPase [Microcoleus sp. herbarium12]|uniref:cation-transporting P-type ATPase n=1 Tax=Microcoleus sp. herbarium12 TaxID=3055437 RepID=UPI003FA611BA